MVSMRAERGEQRVGPLVGRARLAGVVLAAALVLLALALLAKTVASFALSAEMFLYPFQFDESEGMIVAETMLMARGINIYANLTPDLFISAPYPPLYYLLNLPVQLILGDDEPSFKIGRALSLLALLLAGISISGIVWTSTRDRFAAAVTPLLWWSLGLVAYWGTLVKPDMLAVALGLAGLWWLVARPPAYSWWSLPFFIAAFYTKQTAIAAAAAAIVWLILTRPRFGLLFGSVYAAAAIFPSLIINWLTEGGYYYHIVTIHDLPWFPERYAQYLAGFLGAYGVLLLPGMTAAIAAGLIWLADRIRRRTVSAPTNAGALLAGYLAVSILAGVGVGTHGGNHNHFLEWTAASCLGLGLGVAYLRRAQAWPVQLFGAALGFLMLLQIPALFNTPPFLKAQIGQLSATQREGMENIFQYVTNNGGTAYSDNVGLLITTRKALWTTDPFTQTHATYYGRWDQSKLVQAVQEKYFSQIILRIDVFHPDAGAGDVSPEILQAVRDNYKLDQRNVENIYVPR